MRLSKIKLAGFKSFVDPTIFQLPSDLVGIVGPNGCGKSNVIDAVRWVMGEMSAKHLRGDSMADVIFNGSASRKPVGTASIELFFDNSDGSVGGQYAQYGEIALKRTLSRDGTSSYFLNNTRCRRKDITDIFLGTGLGSRSYAIIEQGMVSRLVDAKPDEMRIYIEEAAGISKYKERRRETETRIQHTRDNLARLTDLRDEITKQLEYLQRQAKTAERYKELKARERRIEAELLALRLTELDRALETARLDLSRRETELEAAVAGQRHIEADIVAARERHLVATDAFNAVQARHYGLQSEISRLEQAIHHAREIRERQQADLAQARDEAATIGVEMNRDDAQLAIIDRALRDLEPELERARDAERVAVEALGETEQALEQWQDDWHEFNLQAKELQQVAQVEHTRLEHLEAQAVQLRRQQQSLERERDGIVLEAMESRLGELLRSEAEIDGRARELQSRLDAFAREAEQLRGTELRLGADLEQVTAELASGQGQMAALQAVQDAALGSDDATLAEWLARQDLGAEPRLARQLRVKEPWVLAVETVLGDFLQAICVDDFKRHLEHLPDTHFSLVTRTTDSSPDPATLLAQVAEPGHAAQLLSTVFTAETLGEAIRRQRELAPHQSVVTPDGIWLGDGWARVNRGQRSASGVLARQQRIRELADFIDDHERRIAGIEDERRTARSRLAELTQLRVDVTQEFNSANRDHAETLAVLDNLHLDIGKSRDRREALGSDIAQVGGELAVVVEAMSEARRRADRAAIDMQDLEERRPVLQRRQAELLGAYNDARAATDAQRALVARVSIDFESRRVARDSAQAGIARMHAQRAQLLDRAERLEAEIAGSDPVIVGMQGELSACLEQQLEVDRQLTGTRSELEQVESALRASEVGRASAEKAVASCREVSEGLRMQVREIEIRREGVAEGFAATGAELEVVLREMPADADATRWHDSLEEIRRKIDRLGPINLAAIEQFTEQSERKKYLDAQNDDLTSALETLEQAIRRIDRETRSRFQETFEKINQGLKRIFPRLFGGGHAYLTMEGEEILSAGVTVMARPPGKRNSHIHLLSGGEKALTAVALIFSIFELNPAPFCLLDEVDAPLDEANVGRFCDIVREMSQRVQFVVITHNKTTMEMANQLIGVTMNEPGVSRLVSVDLEAAVQLAAS